MFKKSITILITLLFVVYSNSISVIWMLYFYEKHDVILYYCPHDAQTGGNGMSYVHKLLDGTRQSRERTIISPSENLPIVLEEFNIQFTPKIAVVFRKDFTATPQLGFSTELLRPPTA